MYESVRGRARRVLVVGSAADDAEIAPHTMLAPDGMMIVMEADAARAAELRRRLSRDAAGERTTIIGGEPRRMLYKLAGPFDVIVCDSAHLALRPMLDKLLARDGILITHGEV
jgi:predicted O-methyltransferase YrrM